MCKTQVTKTTKCTTTCGQKKLENQHTIQTKLTSVFVNKSLFRVKQFFLQIQTLLLLELLLELLPLLQPP